MAQWQVFITFDLNLPPRWVEASTGSAASAAAAGVPTRLVDESMEEEG